MEKLVADQHDQREKTQLEVARRVETVIRESSTDTQSQNPLNNFLKCYTYYSFVGVLASLALMMNRGKRMENKQPLGSKINKYYIRVTVM